jgi:hypothetical protein
MISYCNLISSSCYDTEKGKIVTTIRKEAQGTGLCSGNLPPRPPYVPPFNWVAQSPCIAFCTENDPIIAKVKYTIPRVEPNDFNIYRVNDEISILLPEKSNTGVFSLLSIEGKIITTTNIVQSTFNIETANLPRGIYLLSWKQINGNIVTKKILID